MNTGAFGENFPYSNFHDLNLDWIVKIAKDFLDQYTSIQETITNGTEAIENTATQALTTFIQQFNTLADAKTAESIASIPADYTELADLANKLLYIIATNISVTDYGIQLANPLSSDYHAGYYWNSVGGLNAGDNSYVAIKLPVNQGERYCANCYSPFSYFWNETTQEVTGIAIQHYVKYFETDISEIYIPTGVTHLLITLGKSNKTDPIVFKEYHQYFYKPNNFFVDFNKPVINYPTFDNRFKGLKYYSFGDSITYYDKRDYLDTTSVAGSMCQGYQTYVQAVTGFDSYNHGVSGADSNQILTEINNTDVSDARLVTIMTGINDFGRGVSVNTYKQNLLNMIYKIQTDNPRCTLILLSNTFCRYDQLGYITRTYADAMKEVAISANIPFIDNMQDNGINQNNLSNYIADLPETTYELHPNADGYAIIGKQIANKILELLK